MGIIPWQEDLKGGCHSLKLPLDAAKGLVRYLLLRNLVDETQSKIFSPSAALDKLQHWVLLNTCVRKKVEQALGEIYHTTETADLPEEDKCRRRLASMNAMAREGWTPRLDLWQEANTLMHDIKSVDLKKPGTGASMKMYFTEACGQQEILEQIDKNDFICTQAALKRLKRKRQTSVWKPQVSKRASVGGPKFTVSVCEFRDNIGSRLCYSCSGATLAGTLMRAHCNRKGIAMDSVGFSCDGERLEWAWPLSHYSPDGTDITVDVLEHQVGC